MASTNSNSIKKRPRLLIRTEAVWRLLCLKFVAQKYPSLLVTEYPKSGGTWLSQMLSDAAELDFPRLRFPKIGSNLYHGHQIRYFAHVPTVVMWRDPRDVMVSWYYHNVVGHEMSNNAIVEFTRNKIDVTESKDIKENLEKYIKFVFTEQKSPRFTWNQFFDFWAVGHGESSSVIHTSYESLKIDVNAELGKIADQLNLGLTPQEIANITDKYSFKRQARRDAGEENQKSYLRKGIVGDWKNHFDSESLATLEEFTEGRLEQYNAFVQKNGLD